MKMKIESVWTNTTVKGLMVLGQATQAPRTGSAIHVLGENEKAFRCKSVEQFCVNYQDGDPRQIGILLENATEEDVKIGDTIDFEPAIQRLEVAHKSSMFNKELVQKSKFCACFYCKTVFDPTHITEWVDTGKAFQGKQPTALCPRCGIDAVLGDATIDITKEFLQEMHAYWFSFVEPNPVF